MRMLLIAMLFITYSTFAQKIEKKSSGEVVELKDCVSNYCTVYMTATISPDFLVGIDERGICYFTEPDGKRKKFKSNVEMLNYMYDNGWMFITMIVQTNQFVFEKKRVFTLPK